MNKMLSHAWARFKRNLRVAACPAGTLREQIVA